MAEEKSFPQNAVSEGLNYYQPEQTETALKIRLETDDTLERIEMYLNGESYAYNENGDLIKIKDAEPKANAKGVRAIMSVVTAYANKSAVQGNLREEQINMLMIDYHRGMANLLGFHCEEWLINRNERKNIVQFIEPFIFMFISRTKDNKERDSYGMKIHDRGSTIVTDRPRSLNPFKN